MNSAEAWDVVVVGAGPAGAAAGHALAARGRSVLLVDRAAFPRDKVCGGCLSAAALSALRRLGLAQLPADLGARPLVRVELASRDGDLSLDWPEGAVVTRRRFDEALVARAQDAGATFLPRTRAALGDPAAREILLSPDDGPPRRARASVVLAADGLSGRLLERHPVLGRRTSRPSPIGAGATLADGRDLPAPGTLRLHLGRGGYVGLVAAEGEVGLVAAALDPDAVRAAGGVAALAAAIVGEARHLPPAGLSRCRWLSTPPLVGRRARLAADGIFVLGDSAGYAQPLSGEGLAWALAGAAAALPLADAAVRGWRPELGHAFEAWHQRAIGPRRRRSLLLAGLSRRRSFLRLLQALGRMAPGLATALARGLAAPAGDLGLAGAPATGAR